MTRIGFRVIVILAIALSLACISHGAPDAVTLTQAHRLTVSDATQAHAVDNVLLGLALTLAVEVEP